MKRKRFSVFLVGIGLITTAVDDASAKAEVFQLPPSSLVMFWAAWCAPCRGEVSAFPQLSGTAAPRTALILAVDENPQSRAILSAIPPDHVRYTREPLPALFRRFGIKGSVALPLALMTDANGKICAMISGGATVAGVVMASRQCAAAQAASR